MRLLLLVVSLLLLVVNAIYEDQVGKFDWRKRLIGCPNKIVFDKTHSATNRFVVSTQQSILASADLNNGKIAWRRILESPPSISAEASLTVDEEYIYQISDDGRVVRVWRKTDGILVRQLAITEKESTHNAIHVNGNRLFAASGTTLVVYSLRDDNPVETRALHGDRILHTFC
ncbi:unnamed protein product [Caenorhabditis sp. 36 PRJEB53466]|nr:unnamed protein product [Caenorhabditis sp. 36 PRJEB53466]